VQLRPVHEEEAVLSLSLSGSWVNFPLSFGVLSAVYGKGEMRQQRRQEETPQKVLSLDAC